MTKPNSPKPDSFSSRDEEQYWHMAQDTAYQVGAALVYEDEASWLVYENEKQLIIRPGDPDRVWFATWRVLHNQFSGISRLWVGGRPLPSR